MSEFSLMWSLIAQAPAALPHLRLFRRQVVNVRAEKGFRVRAGIVGQADIYALVRGGRVVEIETKARRGVLSHAQLQWQAFCLAFEIPHLVLVEKKGETAQEVVARWLAEIRAVAPPK